MFASWLSVTALALPNGFPLHAVPVPTFGGGSSYVTAMAKNGLVCGRGTDQNQNLVAFVFNPRTGAITTFGNFYPSFVSSNGWTAGNSPYPFIFDGQTVTRIGTQGDGTQIVDMNSQGHVAFNRLLGDTVRGYIWIDGTETDLGTVAGLSERAAKINDNDAVIVNSMVAAGQGRCFIWQNGARTILNPPTADSSYGKLLNIAGHVVLGSTDTHLLYNGSYHAFAGYNSTGLVMNNSGTVVYNQQVSSQQSNGDVYTVERGEFTPVVLGYASNSMVDINNSGTILGGNRGGYWLWDLNEGQYVRDSFDYSRPSNIDSVRKLGDQGELLISRSNSTFDFVVAIPSQTIESETESFDVRLGRLAGGGLQSLASVDGDVMTVCKFLVPNNQVPPISIEFSATAPAGPHWDAGVHYHGRAAAGGAFEGDIMFYNFDRGYYDLASTSLFEVTNQFFGLDANIENDAEPYVDDATGRVTARLRIKSQGPTSIGMWCIELDQLSFHFRTAE